MPYANLPQDPETIAKMDSCVKGVMGKGMPKERAIAICYKSIAEGITVEDATRLLEAGEVHTIESVEAVISPRPGPDFKGNEWEVTIIGAQTPDDLVLVDGKKYVKSLNKRLYSAAGLKASVASWDGVKVYDNHLTDAEFDDRGGMRSVAKEWLGSIVTPWWDEGTTQLRAILKVADEATAKKLYNAHQAGILDTVGLSIDTVPTATDSQYQGMPIVEGFSRIFSLDLVAEPAAGGGFNRLIAAKHSQEANVSEKEKTGTELAPDLVAQIKAIVAEAIKAQQPAEPPVVENSEPEVKPEVDEVKALAEQVQQMRCEAVLRELLDKAKLPDKSRQVVLDAFAGKVFETKDAEKMIANVREAVAAADPTGRVTGAGGRPAVTTGMDRNAWAEAEFLRIVAGNTTFRGLEANKDVTVQERLPESYKEWRKSGREAGNIRGLRQWMYEFYPAVDIGRAVEAATTSSMTSIVKSALNVILAADFSVMPQWWKPLVREEDVDSIDAPTLVRLFGLSTLDVVEEGQAYTELAWVDEEETAAFVKRGNYAAVTLETLLLDKVNKVRTLPQRLATSYYKTLSYRVANVWMTNSAAGPVLGTGGNLFNATALTSAAGHCNLLTAALSYEAYIAARTAMMKQTDMDLGTGAKLLITPKYLVVPVDLEIAAKQIVASESKPGGANNDPNPIQNECQVVVVPDWTDTNNWGFVADPAQYPCIWQLYYRGQRVPELFTADDETSGAMFTNDSLRFKVRMMTFRFSSTYDCAPISDWRGCHWSIVG